MLVGRLAVGAVELLAALLDDVRRHQRDPFAPGGERVDLDLAGALQVVHEFDGLADRGTQREQAVVAQDHRAAGRAEVAGEAGTLVHVEGHAFVAVVGQLAVEAQRVLRQRQQAFLHIGDRHACAGMGVQHRLRLGARVVDAAVDHEAGLVHAHADGVVDDLAFAVDLHQRGRGDLVEHHAERVDQEVVLWARHAGGEVREDEVGPLVLRRDLVGGGEVDADVPLFLADAIADGSAGFQDGAHRGLRGEKVRAIIRLRGAQGEGHSVKLRRKGRALFGYFNGFEDQVRVIGGKAAGIRQ